MADPINLSQLLTAEFLTRTERDALCVEMRQADRYPATIGLNREYVVKPEVRTTSRVRVDSGWTSLILSRLEDWKPRLAAHFGLELENCREPQFLAYSLGDFFLPHRDYGAGAYATIHAKRARLSTVILLNPGEYEGGVLTLHEVGVPGSKLEIRGRPGQVIAFHPLVLHEVTPVTRGERFSIACWYEGTPEPDPETAFERSADAE